MTTKLEMSNKRYKTKKKKQEESIKWDRKSILLLLSCCISIIAVVLFLSLDIKGYFIGKDPEWQPTSGMIVAITAIESMSQSRAGNRLHVSAYKIKYSYIVDNKTYRSEVFLSNNHPPNNQFISRIKIGSKCRVFYNAEKGTSYLDKEIDYIENTSQ